MTESGNTQEIFEQQLERQQDFTHRVREMLPGIYGNRPLALVHTFGCQQNVADSQRIKGMLAEMGFGFTESVEQADLILYNTCAVREHAEDRVFGNVGALVHRKREHPRCLVALCGCMMQQPHIAEKIKKSYPYVDLVFGTHVIHMLPEFVYGRLSGGKRLFVAPESDGEIVEGLPEMRDSGIKGFLSIMYGCNNFCTYCIVPHVRGRERSRQPLDILADFKELVAAGIKDITLLGQNVNSYGRGEDVDFPDLLDILNGVQGDFRIRFMTSHPKDLTDKLIETMARCEKVVRHIHLPVQAGNDDILRAMNRGYTSAEYIALAGRLRAAMPDIAISSDIIVGFPGETHGQFADTLRLVEQVRFSSLFMFIYSKREGTPAASLPDPVSHKEKTLWFRELQDTEEPVARALLSGLVGKRMRVLCEERGREPGVLVGRTEGNTVVEFAGDEALVGSFCEVEITESQNFQCKGKLV